MSLLLYFAVFEMPFSFQSSSSSTIAIILRSAEVFHGCVCPSGDDSLNNLIMKL